MSEGVTIKELLDLSESIFSKMSDITLGVTVTVAMKVREVKGSKDGRDYHFWSQFVVVEDGTAGIGMDLTMSKAEEALAKGMKIEVEKAKTATYEDKDGKTWRKLTKAKVSIIEGTIQKEKPRDEKKEPQATDSLRADYYTIFGPNDKVVVHPDVMCWNGRLKVKTAIAKSFIGAGKLFDKVKLEAETWLDWIYSNVELTEQPEKSKGNSKTKKKKDNPESKDKEKKTAKPLSDDVTPIGDEVMGRIGRLYVKAYQAGKFKKDFELADWLNQNWEKKSLLALTETELKEAEKELKKMVEGKSKK